MIEGSSIVSGRISGIKVGSKYIKNLPIMINSKSLPANSLTNNQTDWRMNMNINMKKTLKNVFKKVVNM